MSFGRAKNLVRRRYRPDGRYHRDRRRERLAHPLTLGDGASGSGILRWLSPIRLLRRLFGR